MKSRSADGKKEERRKRNVFCCLTRMKYFEIETSPWYLYRDGDIDPSVGTRHYSHVFKDQFLTPSLWNLELWKS